MRGLERILAALGLIVAGALLLSPVKAAWHPRRYDVIIRGGTVFDGTGAAPVHADIGIVAGHIATIGNLTAAIATREIDARGLYVAPGFINIHDHSEPAAIPTAANMLTQGVTTSIINPDGFGTTDIARQLADIAARPMATNVGAAIGFNAIWSEVIGPKDRRPTADEIDRMRAILTAQLKNGAWAVSAGLDYKPAFFARTREVIDTLAPAAPWRSNFPSHDRLVPEFGFSSVAAMDETIAIGTATGLVPVVTHIKAQGRSQGSAGTMLDHIRRATASGHYAAVDVYPYTAGISWLSALTVPGWAVDGGREAMLARFRDPVLRARIVREVEAQIEARFRGPAGIRINDIDTELTDVMKARGVGAGEAVLQLLEKSEMGATLRFGREADLISFLKYPASAIACDCGAALTQVVHPRYFGTFPRVLGHYVRDTGTLTWADAIRKMTGLPAATIGLTDRGFLAPGMAADVTVFDPLTIADHATFEHPTLRSEGIRYVLVNGKLALDAGVPTGVTGGKPLFRASYMPSRPESVGWRHIAGSSRWRGVEVRLSVTQRAGQRNASGVLTMSRPGAGGQGSEIGGVRLGLLQQMGTWFGVTGFVSQGRYAGQPVTVIIDDADPLRPHRYMLIVLIAGREVFEGSFTRATS